MACRWNPRTRRHPSSRNKRSSDSSSPASVFSRLSSGCTAEASAHRLSVDICGYLIGSVSCRGLCARVEQPQPARLHELSRLRQNQDLPVRRRGVGKATRTGPAWRVGVQARVWAWANRELNSTESGRLKIVCGVAFLSNGSSRADFSGSFWCRRKTAKLCAVNAEKSNARISGSQLKKGIRNETSANCLCDILYAPLYFRAGTRLGKGLVVRRQTAAQRAADRRVLEPHSQLYFEEERGPAGA